MLPDGAGPGPDLGGGDGGGPGPIFDDPHGTVTVAQIQAPYGSFGSATASFFKEPPPQFQKEVMRAGACRLLTFKPAFCSTPCSGVCVDTDVCRPFPERVSAGTLVLSGLKVPLTLMPDNYNAYYARSRLPADLFSAGAELKVSASGAAFAAFTAATAGVEPLRTDAIVRDEITLRDDADYTFTWTPGSDPQARVRLVLNGNNRGHGQPYEAILECDAPDMTGRLTIARALIAAFPQTFRWEICAGRDCPPSQVRRYRRGMVQAPSGRVAFDAVSERLFYVLHNPPSR
jgi:hypothetical protein